MPWQFGLYRRTKWNIEKNIDFLSSQPYSLGENNIYYIKSIFMKNFLEKLNDYGLEYGYPFFVYDNGEVGNGLVSADGRHNVAMVVKKPFTSYAAFTPANLNVSPIISEKNAAIDPIATGLMRDTGDIVGRIRQVPEIGLCWKELFPFEKRDMELVTLKPRQLLYLIYAGRVRLILSYFKAHPKLMSQQAAKAVIGRGNLVLYFDNLPEKLAIAACKHAPDNLLKTVIDKFFPFSSKAQVQLAKRGNPALVRRYLARAKRLCNEAQILWEDLQKQAVQFEANNAAVFALMEEAEKNGVLDAVVRKAGAGFKLAEAEEMLLLDLSPAEIEAYICQYPLSLAALEKFAQLRNERLCTVYLGERSPEDGAELANILLRSHAKAFLDKVRSEADAYRGEKIQACQL